jgi:hypothetical protein
MDNQALLWHIMRLTAKEMLMCIGFISLAVLIFGKGAAVPAAWVWLAISVWRQYHLLKNVAKTA